MNLEKDVQFVHDAVYKALQRFKGQQVTESTFYQMEATVKTVLTEFLSMGRIETVPLIDINHRYEIAHLREKIEELDKALDNVLTAEDAIKIRNEMAMASWTLDALKSEVRDLNGAQVFFKNTDFSTYAWKIYGAYYE